MSKRKAALDKSTRTKKPKHIPEIPDDIVRHVQEFATGKNEKDDTYGQYDVEVYVYYSCNFTEDGAQPISSIFINTENVPDELHEIIFNNAKQIYGEENVHSGRMSLFYDGFGRNIAIDALLLFDGKNLDQSRSYYDDHNKDENGDVKSDGTMKLNELTVMQLFGDRVMWITMTNDGQILFHPRCRSWTSLTLRLRKSMYVRIAYAPDVRAAMKQQFINSITSPM